MQTYINYKNYFDRKANASELKERDYVYVLKSRAVKFFLQTSVGSAPTSLKNPYQTKTTWYARSEPIKRKTQVLHRMRLQPFTPREPYPTYEPRRKKGAGT